MLAKPTLFRTLTVVVTLLAWLAISNHCALAALHSARAEKACSQCQEVGQKDSGQKAPQHFVTCCKVLKAIEGKALWQPLTVATGLGDYVSFPSEWCVLPQVALASVMPTGPPGVVHVSERDLQRGHRVHAPPFLG